MAQPLVEQVISQNPKVALLRKALAERHAKLRTARASISQFITSVVMDDHGSALELSDMHMSWLRHIEYCWSKNLKPIVLAHFGSGKSSTLAVPVIAWLLGQNSGLRCKLIANDDSSAMRRVSGVAKIIDSQSYKAIFPGAVRGVKWTDHELFLRRSGHALDPSVQARGVLTTGIGGRADLMVFDDVVDQRNSLDPAQRKKVADLIDQTWLSRLEPDAKVLYVATLWHLDDATHHLMQRKGWCTLKQQVATDCQTIEQEVIGAEDDYPVLPWE